MMLFNVFIHNALAAKAMEMRIEHRVQHGDERKYLWGKRTECQRDPKRQCLIEIDGMDQRKTETPRMEDRNKALDRCEVVKNHVVGVYINGKDFFCISHFDHWKKDPNLTISILFQAFKRLPRPWPLILWIQLDNCIGENKNVYMFFMCALLVHWGVFEMVRCSGKIEVLHALRLYCAFAD